MSTLMEYCEGVKKQMSKSVITQLFFAYLMVLNVSQALATPETSSGTLLAKHQLDRDVDEKRASPSRQYSFGIGKKSDELYPAEVERLAELYDDVWQPSYGVEENKRAEPARFNFGIGKKNSDVPSDFVRYSPWKKATANRFAFGIGKRFSTFDGDDDFHKRRYSFGLGKRGQRYEFGIGR